MKTRLVVVVIAFVVCLALGASNASAVVSIPSFAMTTSGTQAGGNADVALGMNISNSSGDSVKDATIALPQGLLVNPAAATICPPSSFQAGACPSSSQIGDGTLSATQVVLGGVQFPLGIYLLPAQGSELARIGIIGGSGGSGISFQGSVAFRGSPSVGLNIVMTGIPNQVSGIPAQINALYLRFYGTANGNAFTRLPTSCATVQSLLTVDSYQAPSAIATSASSLTPVLCGAVPYQPQVSVGASIDPGDDGVGLSASITQGPGEAGSNSITFLLPPGLAPRRSVLSSTCSATCPWIGTVTLRSPLLAAPETGQLLLAGNGGSTASLSAVFPPPIAMALPGTASISGNALQLTLSGIPDVPYTSVVVNLGGGPGSIIAVGDGLCSGPQTVGGQVASQGAATVPVNTALSLSGCRSFGSSAVRPGASAASLSGFASGRPKLHFVASNVTTMSIGLPRGVSFSLRKRGGLSLSGAKLKQLKISQGRLVITLRSSASRAGVTITAPLLSESAGFQRKVKRRQIKSSIVGLKLTGNAGQTSLPLKLKVS